MKDDKISYYHWRTGEKLERNLSKSYPTENKTDLVCPIDNTVILSCYDNYDKWSVCPNCNTDYSGAEESTQEEVNKIAQEKIQGIEKRIAEIDLEKENMLAFLRVVKKNMP